MKAQKFFRSEVSTNWGHLVREPKRLTKREETIKEARRAYRDGIKNAWDIYTRDNKVVQKAKKTLDLAIDEAYKSCLPERREGMPQTEYEQANRLYIQTLYKIHKEFADTIGQNWAVFMKDMENTSSLTKKNTLKSKQ